MWSLNGLRVVMGLGAMVAALPALQACNRAEASPALANAAGSEEALVEAVLEALVDSDRVALQGFLVSREEYETLLWPHMPDQEYTPFEFVWGLNEVNTRKGLDQLLSGYGGIEMELVGMDFPSEPEVYDNFTFHIDVDVMVRRTDTEEVGVLPSFDVLVEYGGTWKLLNYDES
jgi:hypothetical protein